MRLKVISRSTDEFTKERSQDLQRVFRNLDPSLRPQEKAIEYTRALNAAKLDKIFARPFVGAMEGHCEAISCMAKNPHHLKGIFSGSMDGEIRLWDLSSRVPEFTFRSSEHRSKMLIYDPAGLLTITSLTPVSCVIKASSLNVNNDLLNHTHRVIGAIDLKLYTSAVPHVHSIPLESHTQLPPLVSNSIPPFYNFKMYQTNSVCWNPMEPLNFTAANEDCNCYSFDSRKLSEAKCVHQDHVSAVMDIDYSPTGREFVTGSYDRTVRIFPYNGGHSREIYHTKRMQRVFCVKFSGDGSYVISGSDEMNLRLWKAKASEQLGVLLPREQRKHGYHEALINRYKHLPEVKLIVRHKHLPKPVYTAQNLRRAMTDSARRKDDRRRAHSGPSVAPKQPLRKRRIIQEIE
ncbi:uncharacterized protein LOC141620055 [Silene latifolia]|uniref:uncharacterized protein LOC141620055 n=1 Tax=Silene latifolia TaxID=37657 RepID=UPI003D778758